MSDYAPDPKKQQVFTNLQNKTLSDVTGDDIAKLTDPTFIQATNQDALITYNVVNQAAMRDGQPMPDKGGIAYYTQTDANVKNDVRPPKGEVWQIMGISALFDDTPSTDNTFYQYLTDVGGQSTSGDMVFISSVGSGSTNVGWETLEENVQRPLILTNSVWLSIFSNMAGNAGDTLSFRVAYINRR